MTAPAETTDETTQTDSSTETPKTETDNPPKGNREARYRVERNQAREALTAAQARIEAYQRAEVERLAADLAAPGDLFAVGGLELSQFLTEEGSVDSEAVEAAVATILEQRPGLAKDYRPVGSATDPTQSMGNGRVNRQPSFADMLSG